MDLIFRSLVPSLDETIKINLHVDLEFQQDYAVPYPVEKRAFFYATRRISAQLPKVGKNGAGYKNLEKVYSIWICMNTGENCMNHIHLVNDNIIGNHHWKGDIDIFNLIMIGVNDSCVPEADESKFYRFLCALFADPEKVPFQEKKDILNQEYNVWTPEIRKEVETMCNLSQTIAERAEIKGFDKGFNKGTIETLVALVKKNRLSITDAAEEANMTEEEFKKYLS